VKENSISYKTAKQETERLICEIEEATITHRAYTAECLRRVLKENEQLSTEVNSLKEENNVVNKEKADWIKAYREEKDLKENYIQKVKNKMEKDIKTNEHTILGRRNGKTLEYGRRLGRIEMCKELLESEE
jgi:hypothetical protein